jgi:hypothetical protein
MASSAHHGCWIREEAAMATITFNAERRQQHVREQLKTVRGASRPMLDAFASNRLRRAAAEAEHIRSRRAETQSQSQSQSIKAQ